MLHSTHLDQLPLDQRNLVQNAGARLEREFAGTFAVETIERFIVDSFDQLAPRATVTTFR